MEVQKIIKALHQIGRLQLPLLTQNEFGQERKKDIQENDDKITLSRQTPKSVKTICCTRESGRQVFIPMEETLI